MDYLHEFLEAIHAETSPWTEEYRSLVGEETALLAMLEQACGEAPAERLRTVECEMYMLGCKEFFLHGFRACLALMS